MRKSKGLIIKKLLLILTFVLFSFNASSEVVNLKLLCVGKITTYKDGKKLGTDTDYTTVITISDNKYIKGKFTLPLRISDSEISAVYTDGHDPTGKAVNFIFQLNRYTGKFWKYEGKWLNENKTRTDFKGNCEKAKSKKF